MAANPASRRYGPAAFALTALALGAVVGARPAANAYARHKLAQDYPWLHPEEVEVRTLDVVELREVDFDRGWVKGRLNRVTLGVAARSARVEGGHVDVDLDARPARGESSEKKAVTAEGLTVHVKRGPYRVAVVGVGYGGEAVSFTGATVIAPFLVTLGAGTYGGDQLAVASVQAAVASPALPGLASQTVKLAAQGVKLDVRHRSGSAETITGTLQDGTLALSVTGGEGVWAKDAGGFKARSLGLRHPWLSLKLEEVRDVTGSFQLGDVPLLELDAPLKAQIRLRAPAFRAEGSCQEWVAAVGGPEVLTGAGLGGKLRIEVETEPKPKLTLEATCRPLSCEGVRALRKPFTYTAIRADGTPFERRTGPGTAEWVPVGAAGKLPLAVEQLEDPGFAHHRGFIRQAYENSLVENLKTGSFTRGGSTLTMQLVKNVYLGREKTLIRKAQELLLAMALEGCLSKSEIMALYLNVVEFGPNVYGVGAGSHHWFKKAPGALDLTEAFWMASILPRPRKAGPPTEAALANIEKLMARLAEQGKLPDFVPSDGPVDTSGWDAAP